MTASLLWFVFGVVQLLIAATVDHEIIGGSILVIASGMSAIFISLKNLEKRPPKGEKYTFSTQLFHWFFLAFIFLMLLAIYKYRR